MIRILQAYSRRGVRRLIAGKLELTTVVMAACGAEMKKSAAMMDVFRISDRRWSDIFLPYKPTV
jgi:hypothetical protein